MYGTLNKHQSFGLPLKPTINVGKRNHLLKWSGNVKEAAACSDPHALCMPKQHVRMAFAFRMGATFVLLQFYSLV